MTDPAPKFTDPPTTWTKEMIDKFNSAPFHCRMPDYAGEPIPPKTGGTRVLYVPVCEPCLKAEGTVCHTPGCIFIRQRTAAERPITDLDQYTAL